MTPPVGPVTGLPSKAATATDPVRNSPVVERSLNPAIAIVFLIALAMAGLRVYDGFFSPREIPVATPVPVDDWLNYHDGGIHLGDPSAPVTLVEFLDIECSVCKRASPWILGLLEEDRDPPVRVIIRHFARPGTSFLGAVALECAHDQGRFVPMQEKIFAASDSLGTIEWTEFATRAGVPDLAGFRACIHEESVHATVAADTVLAARLGVPGTPSFLVNEMFVAGFGGERYMDRMIRAAEGIAGVMN